MYDMALSVAAKRGRTNTALSLKTAPRSAPTRGGGGTWTSRYIGDSAATILSAQVTIVHGQARKSFGTVPPYLLYARSGSKGLWLIRMQAVVVAFEWRRLSSASLFDSESRPRPRHRPLSATHIGRRRPASIARKTKTNSA
jgi:hypothetical protein